MRLHISASPSAIPSTVTFRGQRGRVNLPFAHLPKPPCCLGTLRRGTWRPAALVNKIATGDASYFRRSSKPDKCLGALLRPAGEGVDDGHRHAHESPVVMVEPGLDTWHAAIRRATHSSKQAHTPSGEPVMPTRHHVSPIDGLHTRRGARLPRGAQPTASTTHSGGTT